MRSISRARYIVALAPFTISIMLLPHPTSKANFSVALDTRGFNGHSSLADVIWSGVPVVYLPIAQMLMAFSGPIMHTFDTLRRALASQFQNWPRCAGNSGFRQYCWSHWSSAAARAGRTERYCSHKQRVSAQQLCNHVRSGLTTASSYLDLARIFANGRALARKLQRKLKSLRVKRGGLYDTKSWTMRFSKAIKM